MIDSSKGDYSYYQALDLAPKSLNPKNPSKDGGSSHANAEPEDDTIMTTMIARGLGFGVPRF